MVCSDIEGLFTFYDKDRQLIVVVVEFAKGEKCIKIQYFKLRFCRDVVLGTANNNIYYIPLYLYTDTDKLIEEIFY